MEPLLNVRENTHIRLFRKSDSESIHKLYMEAMLYGPGSPGNLALNDQLTRPWAFGLYGVFTFGLILSILSVTRFLGVLLSVASAVVFFAWRRNIWSKFKIYCESAVKGDLADIEKHYGTKPSAFWVAEIARGSAAGKIIGCVGLDPSTQPNSTAAELRRMVVSPSYQRRGVGSILLANLITHAREGGLSTIVLSTSMFQKAAMQMYEHFGFIEERKVQVTVKFLFIVSKAYLYFYTLKI